MRFVAIVLAGAIGLSSPAFAQAPAPPAALPGFPAITTDPAKLPLIFSVGINVADMAKSTRFYREAMGATGAAQINAREMQLTFPSGLSLNLVQAGPDSPKGEGVMRIIFQTADIDGLAARVAASGGTVVRAPSDGKATGGVRVAFVKDPDGARIEVIQFPANFRPPAR
jgi:predicted enzyme related to lactoylglutathione lyase